MVCEDFDSRIYFDPSIIPTHQDEDRKYKFYYQPANDFTKNMIKKTQDFINSVLPLCRIERNDTDVLFVGDSAAEQKDEKRKELGEVIFNDFSDDCWGT